ncbi:MAG: Glycosyl transferase family 2 [Candidatus Curtissbacteria bacterium GW2011_GWA1_41_11]|uniref:Glycosyl transferase family 2 n=1 Tax=Candidatus Curtissbacteria bacterium GW2011_GWA1_41_11 TaxID=1618409 RepID=A0A0G0XE93_9BACT|nr:MAG: Glycosyl transferase family 2 [Candidatus Curtissbacteria bacterium GW2011_GWA1_41_11]
MKISVVISAYNEEKQINDCLISAKKIADEIIFIDNQSTDATEELAKKYTNKIFKKVNDPIMIDKNKNYGFSKASGDWIFSLDADERVSDALASEIKRAVQNTKISGFEIPRKNIIFGKWIRNSIWWPDYNLRLFKNRSGRFPLNKVHEKIIIHGEVSRLKNPIIHYNYQTISQFLIKLDNYTESEAMDFIRLNKEIKWYEILRWPVADFLKTFFSQRGYRDGMHGLALSMLQAFYQLVVFLKVWEKKENYKDLSPKAFLKEAVSELSKISKDTRYWVYEALSKERPKMKIIYKIKKKLS